MAFPEDRPAGYDANKVFDEDNDAWYTPTTAIGSERMAYAGGKYKEQLVVVSNQGDIYFKDF